MSNLPLENLLKKYLEENRDNPTVEGILSGTTSFQKQVDQFYKSDRRKFDSEEKRRIPGDIVEILTTFDGYEGIDRNLLKYNLVRKSRIQRPIRKLTESALGVSGILIFSIAVGVGAYISETFQSDLLGKLFTPLIMLTGAFVSYGGIMIGEKYEGNFEEYNKLRQAAGRADSLVKELNK